MQVEIWSDIMCPFCYIGKRKFEAALEKFPNKNEVEIIWRSYQLDPNIKTQPDKENFTLFSLKHLVMRERQSIFALSF